jgi:uncharacterized protein YprB with RNaseH-like and TPR domain
MLQSLWELMNPSVVLATYNGKSFDWPQVHDRSTLHHLGQRREPGAVPNSPLALPAANGTGAGAALRPSDWRSEPTHVDLLHHARRRWRQQLPNCRLQTLERYICGRNRRGDLPGKEIPLAYHEYVRTGQTKTAQAILHHNALDLVTMLQVALVLCRA